MSVTTPSRAPGPWRQVAVADLTPGMRLAEPVRRPRDGVALLPAGQVLTAHHRELFARAGVATVLVEPLGPTAARAPDTGGMRRRTPGRSDRARGRGRGPARPPAGAGAPPADEAGGDAGGAAPPAPAEVTAPEATAPEGDEGLAGTPATGRILADVLRANERTGHPEARAVDPRIGRVAAAAVEDATRALCGSPAVAEFMLTRCLAPGFLGPGLETALLTAITGAALGWDAARLRAAAVAAIVADVGMLLVPREIVHKPGPLSLGERREVERHPELGADLLAELVPHLGALPALVSLQHHERVDGSGYPRRPRSADLIAEAQVVACCHLFLAATSGRSYRMALPPLRALNIVRQAARGRVDPDIAEAFCGAVAAHPVGALVRLSNGECGRVIAGGAPDAPLVRVLWRGDGEAVAGREVDLSCAPSDLHVAAVSD